MNSLNNIIKGLNIGEQAVASYVHMMNDKVMGRGLFQDTTSAGYRYDNFRNNGPRMASYYNIQRKMSEKTDDLKRLWFGELASAANTDGIDIGWSYTTDINQTRFLKGYTSSADFDELQENLRIRNVDNIFQINEKTNRNWAQEGYNKFLKENLEKYNILHKNNYVYDNIGELINFHYLTSNKINLSDKGILELFDEITKETIVTRGKYSYNNPYGINKSPVPKVEYYINETKEHKEYTPIRLINNEGSFLNPDIKAYSYYDENIIIDNDSSVIQGTSVNTFNDNSNVSNLIKKTNELFSKKKIGTLINRFHTEQVEDNELITSKSKHGLSRGRNLLKKDAQSGEVNPYCRVWTAHHQYSRMSDRIRPFISDEGKFLTLTDLQKELGKSMRPHNGAERLGNNSVLQSNGFLKITPINDNGVYNDNIKNYMFSIENLAWKDYSNQLSEEQKGPNKGRIMWFPPYNLKFNENINVNWNGNNFIGRGEQIYTYTNTERSGTLSFTILIDHPSMLNIWRGNGADYGDDIKTKEAEMLRFFAGCEVLNGSSINNGKEKEKKIPDSGFTINNKPTPQTKKFAFVLFFPNNFTGIDILNSSKSEDSSKFAEILYKLNTYERSTNGTVFEYGVDKAYSGQTLQLSGNTQNKSLYNLNSSGTLQKEQIKKILFPNDQEDIDISYLLDLVAPRMKYDEENEKNYYYYKSNLIAKLNNIREKYNIKNIKSFGFASSHGNNEINSTIANNRQNVLISILMKDEVLKTYTNYTGPIPSNCDVKTISGIDINSLDAKIARAAVIIIEAEDKEVTLNSGDGTVNVNLRNNQISGSSTSAQKREVTQTTSESIKVNPDDEYLFFKEVSEKDYLVKNITNRIKHFDPAFHSITPEGFNARLTFLQQCTRQGPTYSITDNGNVGGNDYLNYASNLSFGRAPYCILRIGDFFNTKICIDSISIDYNNGDGTQWDFNPEGAGVQPMMANINMNFKFLGGQDIEGPIERLQNAISYNYYANTSVYEKRSDYGEIKQNLTKNKN